MTQTLTGSISRRALLETLDGPRLVGARCGRCGSVYFPARSFCRKAGCGGSDLKDVELSPRGRLWSFTVQCYQPPPPFDSDQPFEPYAIGLVELPEGIKVLSMLGGAEPDAFEIGMPLQLATARLRPEVVTWRFVPAPGV
jgi:uncharacterized OB-fold protein